VLEPAPFGRLEAIEFFCELLHENPEQTWVQEPVLQPMQYYSLDLVSADIARVSFTPGMSVIPV